MKRFLFLVALLFLLSGCEQITEIYNKIKTGAPCKETSFCLDGVCLSSDVGFPGGMCSGTDCAKHGCLSLTAECFAVSIGSEPGPLCIPTCKNSQRCDRAAEGYECRILDDAFVCLPDGVVHTDTPGITGAACNTAQDCLGDNPICMTDFKNGYCSQESCTANGCLNQEPCVSTDPSDPAAKTLCLKGCQGDNDCRYGYTCTTYNGESVCMPAPNPGPRNPDGQNDGETCVANLNCKGGTCIRPPEKDDENSGQEGSNAYPGGYCTTRDCNSNLECNGGVCVTRGRTTACFVGCNSDADCRTGYSCVDTVQGKICDSTVPLPDVDVTTDGDINIVCAPKDKVEFEIPAGAIGFYVAPFTKKNTRVRPTFLTRPDGSKLNIINDYSFMAINPDLLGTMAPILFPATDEAPLYNSFGGGKYKLDIKTDSSEVCYYVIPKMSEGKKIDLKFYLVGVSGVTAANARQNRDMQELETTMKKIYKKMNIDISVKEYVDAPSAVTKRFKVIRNYFDIFKLIATSEESDTTLDGRLVINVFLINSFSVSEAPGLLGVSAGIPGMAGVHGTIGSGLVFTSEFLGSNNVQLGQTIAHEVGHFIALRHTSEHDGAGHDPISDTPECSNPKLQYACPDARNFMFAFSLGADQTEASDGQGKVLRHSPLVK